MTAVVTPPTPAAEEPEEPEEPALQATTLKAYGRRRLLPLRGLPAWMGDGWCAVMGRVAFDRGVVLDVVRRIYKTAPPFTGELPNKTWSGFVFEELHKKAYDLRHLDSFTLPDSASVPRIDGWYSDGTLTQLKASLGTNYLRQSLAAVPPGERLTVLKDAKTLLPRGDPRVDTSAISSERLAESVRNGARRGFPVGLGDAMVHGALVSAMVAAVVGTVVGLVEVRRGKKTYLEVAEAVGVDVVAGAAAGATSVAVAVVLTAAAASPLATLIAATAAAMFVRYGAKKAAKRVVKAAKRLWPPARRWLKAWWRAARAARRTAVTA